MSGARDGHPAGLCRRAHYYCVRCRQRIVYRALLPMRPVFMYSVFSIRYSVPSPQCTTWVRPTSTMASKLPRLSISNMADYRADKCCPLCLSLTFDGHLSHQSPSPGLAQSNGGLQLATCQRTPAVGLPGQWACPNPQPSMTTPGAVRANRDRPEPTRKLGQRLLIPKMAVLSCHSAICRTVTALRTAKLPMPERI
jgi:hypothetical protein